MGNHKGKGGSKMNKIISIKELREFAQKELYIGYLWLSDQTNPEEYHSKSDISNFLKEVSDDTNPFIIEGNLYSEDAKKSYSIKYVDCKHIVVEYDLSKVPDSWKEDMKKFIPNRLKASKIVFLQYWKPQEDEFCEGMEVLQPAALVFTGFEYLSNKEKEEK